MATSIKYKYKYDYVIDIGRCKIKGEGWKLLCEANWPKLKSMNISKHI